MKTNGINLGPIDRARQLGVYLRGRRAKLDPSALGLPLGRRRTPGLRREEVAQRAHVSATWYTWLEQGRGGSPSPDVLDRIARALMLTRLEREHLFHLALGHPPEVHYEANHAVSPRLQRLLDALEFSPALVKTVTWDVVAWNRAAAALFQYDSSAPLERNVLRRIFLDPTNRAMQQDWQSVARFVVSAFRADIARAGASASVEALVAELCRSSADFDRMWRENDVRIYGEGTKKLHHPKVGLLEMEYSSFHVDGQPELGLVIYNPATPHDAELIRTLMRPRPNPRRRARGRVDGSNGRAALTIHGLTSAATKKA